MRSLLHSSEEVISVRRSLRSRIALAAHGVTSHNLDLFGGRAGCCLALVEDAAEDGDSALAATALEAIVALLNDLSDTEIDVSLGSGLAGIGFLLQHTSRLLPKDTDELQAPLAMIDAELCKHVAQFSANDEIDLVSGLAGIGLYAIKRSMFDQSRLARAVLAKVVEFASEIESGGVTWARAVPARRIHELGTITDLGVAHGVPGILYFLSEIQKSTLSSDMPPDLLLRATSGFLSKALVRSNGDLTFPYVSDEVESARLAWCYGDVGVSAVLLNVAVALKSEYLREVAVSLACNAYRTRRHESAAMHWSICHGQIGIAAIYASIATHTGESELQEAASYWRTAALQSLVQGWNSQESQARQADSSADCSLLEGWSGALCFLATRSRRDSTFNPRWSDCLFP